MLGDHRWLRNSWLDSDFCGPISILALFLICVYAWLGMHSRVVGGLLRLWGPFHAVKKYRRNFGPLEKQRQDKPASLLYTQAQYVQAFPLPARIVQNNLSFPVAASQPWKRQPATGLCTLGPQTWHRAHSLPFNLHTVLVRPCHDFFLCNLHIWS